ncbi:MAG: phage tail tube protein [Methylobacter sp.]
MSRTTGVGIVYKGDVYARRWSGNVLSPEIIGPIAGTKLTIKANNEVKKRFGKGRSNHGLLTGSIATGKPTEVGLGFNEVEAELMAILFLGVSTVLNDAGGSVTGESITLVKDTWVKTAKRNISASAITGLVLGTDFIENPRIGAIKALTVGAAGAQSLAYTHGAIAGTRIAVGVDSKIDVEIIFDGQNLEDSSETYIRIPKITLTPTSAIDLLAGEYVDGEFTGEAIKLSDEVGEIIYDDSVVYS